MVYLILCILLNVVLFTVFRGYTLFRINTFQAVIVNYFVCFLIGLLFLGPGQIPDLLTHAVQWMPFAFLTGIFLITGFTAVGETTRLIGMSVASIASKMSMIIPVIFALFIFDIEGKKFDAWNYLGIFIGIAAIVLSSGRPAGGAGTREKNWLYAFLPMIVFLIGGALDTTINYVNLTFLQPGEERFFPVVIFLIAGLLGSARLFLIRKRFETKSIVAGIALGIPNYFSIYTLLKALSSYNQDGALLFPILNISIILLSTLVSQVFFKERLSRTNYFGLILAILAIYMISYQEIKTLISP